MLDLPMRSRVPLSCPAITSDAVLGVPKLGVSLKAAASRGAAGRHGSGGTAPIRARCET
jgi:hypothetical protein